MKAAWRQLRHLGVQLDEQARQGGGLQEQQEDWLLGCLHRNRKTAYGRRFGFNDIHTPDVYRKRVPLAEYDDLVLWIERTAAGEEDVLFAGRAIAFERTGGSTGGSRLIPYSTASLADFQTAILPWLSEIIAGYNLEGSAYWAVSPALRSPQQTEGGIPIGLSDAAYLGDAAIPAFLQTLAVPQWVGTISNLHDWRLTTLYWLVRREDIELISVWSPTFFLSLLTGLEERAGELATIFRRGSELAGYRLDRDQAALDRLEAYLASHETERLWPKLKVVSCWGDASSRPFCSALKKR
ncbi:MAG: Auxin-responsive GH3-related protein, partial [Candidatus Electrothrix sp. AR3]|nr:Auxin-responsive GH3-related protein [Candidatus Electrothrix sp. AR3]